MRQCSIGGCDNRVNTRGLCSAHYNRLRRHGDPLGGGAFRRKGAQCAVAGCCGVVYARLVCEKHYGRLRTHGDPLHAKGAHDPEERFALLTERAPNSDCEYWTGSIASDGYGSFSVGGRSIGAHRYAWERVHGPITGGLVVRHSCHVRRCVNIDHLSLGTQQDNVDDMYAAGRGRALKGEEKSQSKLTDKCVREIRASACANVELAAMYGVSDSLICNVRKGKRWAHIELVDMAIAQSDA